MATLTYSVREAAAALGVSKSTAYAAIEAGEIPSFKIRGRIVVPKMALRRLLVASGSASDGASA